MTLHLIPGAHPYEELEAAMLRAAVNPLESLLGQLQEDERDKYLLLGLALERVLSNPLFIGCQLATPSYVSFWSGLHFYSFTEQVPAMVQIGVARRKKPIEFQGTRYHFILISPGQFFGFRR